MWRLVGVGVASAACVGLATGAVARVSGALWASGWIAGRCRALGMRLAAHGAELSAGVPPLVALRAVRERAARTELAECCERQMPEFLDILGLGLSAGLSFDAALELYCGRRDTELGRVLRDAMQSWQMGLAGRGEALESMAARVCSPSVSRFSGAVCEALAFGSPLADALEHQAASLREEQRSATQQRVEEAPVRMLIPLGTLVVPAMLLAILGPLLSGALSM